ncbi:reverse transcriptase/maturase family protein [Ktedonobacter racemifer]|uniref:RNA-directed DNA polymerase n=1 Tax=Ktedonobacter racemifer DSM 44963 TaxID=485913 RepID=D6U3A7_KTERA|nr:reverse transcriptase/maturase family protein [Ktedonobacter racemifer]EFH81111.1 RNA-directed DNA polymerase [Ktedonobacter racemifer DSM 44963]
MRSAETVLSIIRERGKRGLPLEDIYRQFYNPELYLMAYGRLYANKGALTPGSTPETVDRMSLAKIEQLIDDLRHERYRWTPVRRTYVAKKNGRLRALGLPTWSDKLLQEVIRLILEAYYEPQFSSFSHGFRPGRGCHTALTSITDNWSGTKWFIEGDISQYFDTIDHTVLLTILGEKLKDNRFLRLLSNLLRAGYLEDWKYHRTLSGSPQGGVVSPILSNIYLDKFDAFVEQVLIPEYTRGAKRRPNLHYEALRAQANRRKRAGKRKEAQRLWTQVQHLPSRDPHDPDYRRLKYVRYADDTLFGFIGPKAEAEEIKGKIANWLRENLKLSLSLEKTLITNASSDMAHFLGYEIVAQRANEKHNSQSGYRTVNGKMGLRVPAEVIQKRCTRYMRKGVPAHRNELIQDDDYTIINRYQAEYRSLIQYYVLAINVSWFHQLHWVMQASLLRTLARKHRTSLKAMAEKFRATTETPYERLSCLEIVVERANGKKPLVAQFGGIPLRRQEKAILTDLDPIYSQQRGRDRNELIKRLLAEKCELCGSHTNIEVHHIRKLADLREKGRKEKPRWVKKMAQRRRKTLIVCANCHENIHRGDGKPQTRKTSLESGVR